MPVRSASTTGVTGAPSAIARKSPRRSPITQSAPLAVAPRSPSARSSIASRRPASSAGERVGKNRKVAERARDKAAVQVAEGDYQQPRTIRFAAWADLWIAGLERKETTRASYRSTVVHAKEVFGHKEVRKITLTDIAAFNRSLRDRKVRPLSASSRARHLRVLSACLSAAVEHGYAARNPVKALPRAERPRAAKREAAYFENAELPGLMAALPEGVYRVIATVALKTGCREGELIALTWSDLDLVDAVLHVRRTRTDGHTHAPKSGEGRKVDLASDVVDLLGRWWGELGQPHDETIVFPGATRDCYLDPSTLRRELYRAMKAAGIDRVGRPASRAPSTRCDTPSLGSSSRPPPRSRGSAGTLGTRRSR